MKPDGFTLVEIMIALLIVSISFPALFRAEWLAMHQQNRLFDNTRALEIAQQKMETWRGIATLDAYRQLASGQEVTRLASTRTELRQTWTVQAFSSPPCKSVRLVVSWQQDQDTNSIMLSTIIAQPFGEQGN